MRWTYVFEGTTKVLSCWLSRTMWRSYTNQCASVSFVIVTLLSSLSVPSVMLLSNSVHFTVFTDLLLLALWVAAEHSPALSAPNSKLVVERVENWIFTFAVHCFSEQKLPLLQILDCSQKAACCSLPLLQEEGRKHPSAEGQTCLSWLIQDLG